MPAIRPLSVLTCLGVFAAAAVGAETVIRNDSLEAGQFGNVQVGFVAGESAAAWLTSPCDGTIVAIQIFWLSASGTAPPSIEDSITIFRAGSFPNPGEVLEMLEAPVLQDNALNEFRYIDEQGTIPLQVPVTAGQTVVVALKFAQSPPATGPSVVTDLSGCQAGKNGIFAIPPNAWFNACMLGVSGDFVIRAVVNCGTTFGACCYPNGTCQVKTAAECAAGGGTYQGDNTNCATVQCPPATGACCIAATQGCLNLSEADCGTVGGFWAGAGTSCATYVCFPKGACCKPDGACVDNVSPTECGTLGGTFQGNGTVCVSVKCPPPSGACCLPGGCLVLSAADCAVVAGTWAGPATNCQDGNSNGKADVCERLKRGDLNCDAAVTFDYINPFVLALGDPAGYAAAYPGCPRINADCNGNGLVSFDDINAFVALLAGP